MRYINGSYVTYFNAKYKRVGHLLASRYKAILVDRDSYVVELSRYIHLNPVKAKIVALPSNYRWSSYKSYIGKRQEEWVKTDFVLKIFSREKAIAQKRYGRFVLQGIDGKVKDPLKEIVGGMVLGKRSYADELIQRLRKDAAAEKVALIENLLKLRPSLDAIETLVDQNVGLSSQEKRKVCIYLCQKYSGRSLSDIGEYFGGIKRSGANMVVQRFKLSLQKNEFLKKIIHDIENQLN